MTRKKTNFKVIEGGASKPLGEEFRSPASLGRPVSVDELQGSLTGVKNGFDNERAIEEIRERFDRAWGEGFKCLVVLISEKTDSLKFLPFLKDSNPVGQVKAFREMTETYNQDNDPEWTVLMAVDTDLTLESQVPAKILNGVIPLKTLKITPVINHRVYNPHNISPSPTPS